MCPSHNLVLAWYVFITSTFFPTAKLEYHADDWLNIYLIGMLHFMFILSILLLTCWY